MGTSVMLKLAQYIQVNVHVTYFYPVALYSYGFVGSLAKELYGVSYFIMKIRNAVQRDSRPFIVNETEFCIHHGNHCVRI